MLAPITIFCYKRLDTLKQTVEALKINREAIESELYVFSDGYKSDNDKEKVNEVRNYLKTIDGFKNITIYEAPENKGLAKSITDGVTEIVNKHDKIIIIEDDVKVSPHFLSIMNRALDMYKDDNIVSCISGFSYPIDIKETTYFVRGAECAVWATWKRAWDVYEENGEILLTKLKTQKLEYDFDFEGAFPYIQMLKDQIAGKIDSWAIKWYASCFLNNMLCLYFKNSLNINIGFENEDATHCKGTCNWYNKGYCSENIYFKKIDTKENLQARQLFIKFFQKISSNTKGNFFLKKEKIGNKRKIKILGFIKFSYKKGTKNK